MKPEAHMWRLYVAAYDICAPRRSRAAAEDWRRAYSSSFPHHEQESWESLRKQNGPVAKQGFVWLKGRQMRMTRPRATASCGVVTAHHQAPLAFVLRELREAAQKARAFSRPAQNSCFATQDGDALHLGVIKRSGGTLEPTLRPHQPRNGYGMKLVGLAENE